MFCSRRPWNNASGPWKDHDSIQLACWLQRHGIEVGHETAYAAVVAAAPLVNCAVDWIHSLEWDGTPRVAGWLPTYMKVRTQRDGRDITNYVCAAGTAWLVGGVARLLQPGCQMDFSLIFYGAEGVGKTTALRILSNGWYTDSIRDITSPFAPVLLAGKWIIEFAELEVWGKADRRQLRAFISRRTDSFRAPYGRTVQDVDRTCVFGGTTNEALFIEEGSEDRRLWPVECAAPVDLEGISRDYPQLWAEARDMYLSGAHPYLADERTAALASIERTAYRYTDPWLPAITKYMQERPIPLDYRDSPLTVSEVLSGPLGAEKHRQTRADAMRVASCLKLLGYVSFQYGPKRLAGWRPAEREEEEEEEEEV
jgi:predicted P-loop ATPase